MHPASNAKLVGLCGDEVQGMKILNFNLEYLVNGLTWMDESWIDFVDISMMNKFFLPDAVEMRYLPKWIFRRIVHKMEIFQ